MESTLNRWRLRHPDARLRAERQSDRGGCELRARRRPRRLTTACVDRRPASRDVRVPRTARRSRPGYPRPSRLSARGSARYRVMVAGEPTSITGRGVTKPTSSAWPPPGASARAGKRRRGRPRAARGLMTRRACSRVPAAATRAGAGFARERRRGRLAIAIGRRHPHRRTSARGGGDERARADDRRERCSLFHSGPRRVAIADADRSTASSHRRNAGPPRACRAARPLRRRGVRRSPARVIHAEHPPAAE